MYGGPPTWTYFLTPAVSLLAVVLAYLLGNAQGRAQTRYDRATDSLTRILALAIEAEDYLETLRSLGTGNASAEWSDGVVQTVGRMEDVYRSSRPWLVPDHRKHVDEILAPFNMVVALLVSTRDLEATTGLPADAASLGETLKTFDVETPIGVLDDKVTRLASAPSVLERLWLALLDWLIRVAPPKASEKEDRP